MVLLNDADVEFSNNDAEQEWIILDSGSDVSLLPAKYRADEHFNDAQGTLQNCQGGALRTTGTKRAELIATTIEGEEVLLQHDFIVGNVWCRWVSYSKVDGQFKRMKWRAVSI